MKEVRQALAYAINFEENAFVSLAESGVVQDCMCGFSDNMTPLWLSDDTLANLNPYSQDLELAEQMLLDIGFTRDDDGVWLDDTRRTHGMESDRAGRICRLVCRS